MLRLLLIGGSGLVGRHLVERLTIRKGVELDLLLRRTAKHEVASVRVFAGDPLPEALRAWCAAMPRCDVFVSALGTTRRAAGSHEAFAAIDRDLVLQVARCAREAGARQAVLVSTVGADARSLNAYLRVKGELEEAVQQLGFERCDFLQPGLLLGVRDGQAERPAERLGQRLAPLLNPLMVGPLQRYRAVSARQVALAAAELIGSREPGVWRHVGGALRPDSPGG